jgi:putative RNA 2'-phosphotransferase
VDLVKVSRQLSYVLRHRPDSIGLSLGDGGWIAIDDLLNALAQHGTRLSHEELEFVVERSDKRRFSIADGRIRANQGHSVDVDLGLAAKEPPVQLYHGTATRFLDSIMRQGLLRGSRHHVHLSAQESTARNVGARHGRPVVLSVASEKMAVGGHEYVPPGFLGVLP